jgi:hypothetical protein
MTQKHFTHQELQKNFKDKEQTCQVPKEPWETPELFEADYGITGGKTAVGVDGTRPGSG